MLRIHSGLHKVVNWLILFDLVVLSHLLKEVVEGQLLLVFPAHGLGLLRLFQEVDLLKDIFKCLLLSLHLGVGSHQGRTTWLMAHLPIVHLVLLREVLIHRDHVKQAVKFVVELSWSRV
jgi:hypothetical protein